MRSRREAGVEIGTSGRAVTLGTMRILSDGVFPIAEEVVSNYYYQCLTRIVRR